VNLVGRWWNGLWGGSVRRDVVLIREERWRVVARRGDADSGQVSRWSYETEQQAREMVDRLLRAQGPGEWREFKLEPGARPPFE
jgi:cobalamin biosynthesis Mg chelatase CobN